MLIDDLINYSVYKKYLEDEDKKTKENTVVNLVKQGNRIKAIKFMYRTYNFDIRKARFLVEGIMLSHGLWFDENMYDSKGRLKGKAG